MDTFKVLKYNTTLGKFFFRVHRKIHSPCGHASQERYIICQYQRTHRKIGLSIQINGKCTVKDNAQLSAVLIELQVLLHRQFISQWSRVKNVSSSNAHLIFLAQPGQLYICTFWYSYELQLPKVEGKILPKSILTQSQAMYVQGCSYIP